MYLTTYLLHVLVHILTTCTCPHTHYMYLSAHSLHVLVHILTTCTCPHTHYMYLSTYSLHVLVHILTTCTCQHTHYMYLSTYSLHALVYMLTTCTCTYAPPTPVGHNPGGDFLGYPPSLGSEKHSPVFMSSMQKQGPPSQYYDGKDGKDSNSEDCVLRFQYSEYSLIRCNLLSKNMVD